MNEAMNNVCPECESVREIAVGSRLEETVVKGVAVGAKAVYSQCTYCTREFVTAEQMEVSLNNAYEEYNEQVNNY